MHVTGPRSFAWPGQRRMVSLGCSSKWSASLNMAAKRCSKADSAGISHPRRFRSTSEWLGIPKAKRAVDPKAGPFFEGVVMLDDRRLLRRATLSLAGRLPTEAGIRRSHEERPQGDAGDPRRVDARGCVLRTASRRASMTFLDAWRRWQRRSDVPVLRALRKDPALVSEVRLEPHQGQGRAAADGVQDGRRLSQGDARRADEAHRVHRPQRSAVHRDRDRRLHHGVRPTRHAGTASSKRSRRKFKNPDDPFEYIPVKLKALIGRSKQENQESATGFLSARGHAQHVPVSDALSDDRNEPQPTARPDVLPAFPRRRRTGTGRARVGCRGGHREVQESRRCKRPSASSATRRSIRSPGCFRTIGNLRTRACTANARAAGSPTCSAPASKARTCLPTERWRSLQWLGERTAKDPRFAVAMIEHVYYILTGRKVLLPPKDLDDPLYRRETPSLFGTATLDRGASRPGSPRADSISRRVFKDWVVSDFYRADGLATAVEGAMSPRGTGRHRSGADARAGAGRAKGRSRFRRDVGPTDRTARRCSTAGSIPRRSPTGPPIRAARWGRSSGSLSNDVACQARRPRLRPAGSRTQAVSQGSTRRRAGTSRRRRRGKFARRLSNLHERDSRPLTTRPDFGRGVARSRSTSSLASSRTPRSKRRSKSRNYHCRAGQGQSRRGDR